MTYDPAIHHRRSIRLRGYDYSRAGAYFVTLCTQQRKRLFGKIVNGELRLNDKGADGGQPLGMAGGSIWSCVAG